MDKRTPDDVKPVDLEEFRRIYEACTKGTPGFEKRIIRIYMTAKPVPDWIRKYYTEPKKKP